MDNTESKILGITEKTLLTPKQQSAVANTGDEPKNEDANITPIKGGIFNCVYCGTSLKGVACFTGAKGNYCSMAHLLAHGDLIAQEYVP